MTEERNRKKDRAKFVFHAQEFYKRELRDRLIDDYEGCVVLVDGRNEDYEVQRMTEPRFRARARLLKRHPDAEIVVEHIVSDDFSYSAPSTAVHAD